MKHLILSLALGSMVAIAFAPAAFAGNHRQTSRAEGVSLAEFVRNNRDARKKG